MVDRGRLACYANIAQPIDPTIRIDTPNETAELLCESFTPGPWDVICQGGKESYDHVGNRRFRICIQNYLDTYTKATSKHAKSIVVSSIVDAIRDCRMGAHGGFVRKHVVTNRWYEVTDLTAREKVGHALRDAMKLREKQKEQAATTVTSNKDEQQQKDDVQQGAFAPTSSIPRTEHHFKVPVPFKELQGKRSSSMVTQDHSDPGLGPIPSHQRKQQKLFSTLGTSNHPAYDAAPLDVSTEGGTVEGKFESKEAWKNAPGGNSDLFKTFQWLYKGQDFGEQLQELDEKPQVSLNPPGASETEELYKKFLRDLQPKPINEDKVHHNTLEYVPDTRLASQTTVQCIPTLRFDTNSAGCSVFVSQPESISGTGDEIPHQVEPPSFGNESNNKSSYHHQNKRGPIYQSNFAATSSFRIQQQQQEQHGLSLSNLIVDGDIS